MHASADILEQYLLGGLPTGRARDVHEHLSSCDVCQQTLCGLESQHDTIAMKLRDPKPDDPFERESSCQELLKHVSKFGQSSTSELSDEAIVECAPGEMIREYQLLEPLGAGGMGTVFKALHTKLNRVVALKCLSPEKISAAAISRFEREMQIVGQLDHPHIVRATDAGVFEGVPYLVMELLDGVDLDHLLRAQGPLDVGAACSIICQAAIAVQYAFERGVVHRDIKPSNMMLARDTAGRWQVKVLDLGLAMFEQPLMAPGELTSDGQLMGTLDYMAPEQAENTHGVDIRADIYSLGATLFRLLAGVAPLADPQRDSVMKKLAALATAEPPDIRTLRPDVPASLAALIRRLLSKRPEDRPFRPIEVAEFLAPFAVGYELATLPADPITKQPLLRPVDVLQFASSKRQRRERRLIAVAGLALLLLLAVLVFQFTTRDGVITVELDSPQSISSIKVDGHVVDWTLAGNPRSYRFQVKPGPIAAIVLTAEDGTEITAEIPEKGLQIAAGRSFSLTASAQKPTADPALSPADSSKDRAVATWAHRQGGRVGLTTEASRYVDIHADDELPEGDFRLVVLDLNRRTVRNADLAQLDGLRSLSLLMLHSTAVTDQGLALLGDLPVLRGLYFGHSQLADAGLKTVAERFPRLEILHIGYTRITDGGVEALLNCSQLTELRLEVSTVTDRSVPVLSQLRRLRLLNLIDSRVTKAGLDQLHRALPACRIESNHGVLEPSELSDDVISADRAVAEWAHALGAQLMVRTLPAKSYLSIPSGNPLPDEPFELIDLNLTGRPIQDRDLVRIDGLKACSSLSISGTAITDTGLASLGTLPQLKTISITETQITDAGLKVLTAKYPTLTVLHAGHSKVSDDGIRALVGGPKLVELRLDTLPLTDQAVDALGQLMALRILSLKATRITRPGIERLHAALPACRIDSDYGVFEYSEPGDYALEFHFPSLVTVPTLKYDGGPVTVEVTMQQTGAAHFPLAIIGTSRVLFWKNDDWHGVQLDHEGQMLAATAKKEVPLDRPVRMACTFNGETLLFFLDGKVVAKGTRNPQQPPRPAGGYLGGYVEPSYRGRMDELRVSKVARYTEDYVPSQRFEPDADTVALYHFDEGHGTELNDSSGNNHHGTIRGAVWVRDGR